MFWEIKILLPSLHRFRKSKDRDKAILPSKLRYSIDICCCIMNELEIHVVSTPQRGIDSVEVSVCGLRDEAGHAPCRKLVVDVSPAAPSPSTVQPSDCVAMQKDEASLQMEEALAMNGEELDDSLDDMDVFAENLTSVIPTSRPETPVTISTGTGTSPPIPIPLTLGSMSPLGGPTMGSGSLVSTPTRGISFSYSNFCRLAASSPDSVSPLSSGYGSAPRFFASTSTQTPPLSPVLHETQITLRLFNSPNSSSPSSEEQGQCREQRFTRQESRRGRYFSEGSDQSDSSRAGQADRPLPDVIAGRRDRANSVPSRMVAPEIVAGRELRRIGDEFVALFEGQRSLRRAGPHRRSFIRRFLDRLTENEDEPRQGNPNALVREGSLV